MVDDNDTRTLNVTYYDEATNHAITLRKDELNNLVDVLERLMPVLHTAGFQQTKMRIDDYSNIVFYTDERGFFDEEETRFWEDVYKAEKVLYEGAEEETSDYWSDAVDAEVSKKVSFKVGDEVIYTGKGIGDPISGHGGQNDVSLVGEEGYIVKVSDSDDRYPYLVCFYDWFDGHDGGDFGGKSHWWVTAEDIEENI
jgi:hypothetical protein